MAKKQSATSEIKPQWTLIYEDKSELIDKLFKIYAEDKEKARIFYFLNRNAFYSIRKVLFEEPNGDFRFVIIKKTYGISSTCRMYSREKTLESVSYAKKKFHYYNNERVNSYVRQLNYMNLNNFCIAHNHTDSYNTIMDYFIARFGWIRYIRETEFWGTSFNVIQSKKIFDLKSMLRYQYSCPYPVAKFVHEYTSSTRAPHKYHRVWKEMRKHLINIENLKEEMFRNVLFQDSCEMAQMVGQKINCSWSIKRLKAEHDKWAKAITKIKLETEPLLALQVGKIYKEFAEHSGLQLLTTNHDLIAEGMSMHHCVGTYADRVNNGVCGIYKAFGCTLDVRKWPSVKDEGEHNALYINQYMDVGNQPAAKELQDRVQEMINTFKPSIAALVVEEPVDNLPF